MFRVDTSTADAVLPAQQPVGVPGFFTKGNPPGTPATIPGPDWFNIVQEELIALLVAANIAPNKATTNQVLAAILVLIGNYISSPNFFVDPCCRVAQGAVVNLSTSRQWGLVDLVQVWASGTAVSAGTITQDGVGTAGGKTPWSVKVAGASITGAGKIFFRRFLSQIEAQNLAGKNCIFSAVAFQDTGVAINGFITLNYANAANNFGAVTFIGSSAATVMPNNASTIISYAVAIPAAASNGIEMIVELDVGAIAAKDAYCTDFCASVGTAVPNFPVPHFNSDLLNVKRWLEKSYAYATPVGTVTGACAIGTFLGNASPNSGIIDQLCVRFSVEKGVTPTVTLYSPNTGASGKIYNNSATADIGAGVTNNGTAGFEPTNGSGGAIADGSQLRMHWQADARL